MISFENANSVYEYYFRALQKYGMVSPNGTKVMFNIAFCIANPELNKITNENRDWKRHYAEREWKWYQSGNRSVSELKKHAPIWDKMHGGDDLVWSNYGYWWKENEQLEKIKIMLKENPFTRRAVLVHYDVDQLDNFTYDTPCNLVVNFHYWDGKLNMTIFARSIDIWYGFCNDQYIFSKLLIETAMELEMGVGNIAYFITNLHLYQNQDK